MSHRNIIIRGNNIHFHNILISRPVVPLSPVSGLLFGRFSTRRACGADRGPTRAINAQDGAARPYPRVITVQPVTYPPRLLRKPPAHKNGDVTAELATVTHETVLPGSASRNHSQTEPHAPTTLLSVYRPYTKRGSYLPIYGGPDTGKFGTHSSRRVFLFRFCSCP